MQLFAQKHNRQCGAIFTLNPIWSENKFTKPFGHDLILDEKHDGTYTIEHNDLWSEDQKMNRNRVNIYVWDCIQKEWDHIWTMFLFGIGKAQ